MTANNGTRGSGGSLLINLLTLVIIGLILLVLAGFVAALVAPDLVRPLTDSLGLTAEEEAADPTPTMVVIAVVPTAEKTPTPEGFLAPTWTPPSNLGGEALEPTATNTRRPTLVPSITPTFPPWTPTPTPTNTPTPTGTPGPSPTATITRAPFPFTSQASSPQYLQNFANNAGCNWLGIAGEVLDLNGNPVAGGQFRVHVWGPGIDERVPVGGAPAYSPSGWEQFINDAPVVRDYNVQLETVNGTPVSQAYSVQTRASCNQNLVLFNFIQNHSL